MGFTPATGTEISMGCVYGAFGLTPYPGINIGLNSTLGVTRQPPQAAGVTAIASSTVTTLSSDMGGLETIDDYCGVPDCYVYEYINNSVNTISLNGTLCDGGSYSINVAPSAEGATFCLQIFSQSTIDAYSALGLVLTPAATICNPGSSEPFAVSQTCGVTFTSTLWEPFIYWYKVPLGTATGTSSWIFDVAASVGAGTTGVWKFELTYNNTIVADTGWVSREINANSTYLSSLNSFLTSQGLPTTGSISVITNPSGLSGSFNKNLSLVQNVFVTVYTYYKMGSRGCPYVFRVDCL
jgi:hypothetical protein